MRFMASLLVVGLWGWLILPVAWAEDLQSWMTQASRAAEQGQFKMAERCYRNALQQETDHPYANLGLAAMLKAQGKTNEARHVLEVLLQNHPQFQPGYYLLGLIYESQGETAKARQAFQTYVAIAPGNIPPEPGVRIKLRQLGVL